MGDTQPVSYGKIAHIGWVSRPKRNKESGEKPSRGWKWSKRRTIVSVALGLVLVWLSSGIFYTGNIAVFGATWNQSVFGHTYTSLYSTPTNLGSSTGGALTLFNFNNTTPAASGGSIQNGECVTLAGSNFLRFKYDIGKTGTSYGYGSDPNNLQGFQMAALDYGGLGWKTGQQQHTFYAQNRWWVFFTNHTVNNGFIIYTSSPTGSNATGSWIAGTASGSVPNNVKTGAGEFAGDTYQLTNIPTGNSAPDYMVATNNTHVFLMHAPANEGANIGMNFILGTLSNNGNVAWGTDRVAITGSAKLRIDNSWISVGPKTGSSTTDFRVLITTQRTNYTIASPATHIEMDAVLSTAIDYSSWGTIAVLRQIDDPSGNSANKIINTTYFSTSADLGNQSGIVAYGGSAPSTGDQGSYSNVFEIGRAHV